MNTIAMTHEQITTEVKRQHAERFPNGCRPAPDWCVECAARLTGRTEAQVFSDQELAESMARLQRNRACYRCGASPEHCDCPDEMEPDGVR